MKLTEKKRQQIIESAIQEFLAAGFSDTSMDKVAACANVSKRTVYNHFESKEALFIGVIDHMLDMVEDSIKFEYDQNQAIEEQLRHLALQSINLFSNDLFVNLAKLVIRETIGEPERIQVARKRVDHIEQSLAHWFELAMEDGKLLRQDPWIIEGLFFGGLRAFCFYPQILKNEAFPSQENLEKIIDAVVLTVIRAYGVDSNR